MRKGLVLIFSLLILSGCHFDKGESSSMDIQMIEHNGGIEFPTIEDQQLSIEEQLMKCLENIEERVRLIYFSADLERDLNDEKAVEIIFEEAQTVQLVNGEDITVDQLIIFGSGRLATNFSAPFIPIITMYDNEINVWHCKNVWQ